MAGTPEYGSDIAIDVLKALDVEYVAINPGASFRGLHDSVVNYGGNKAPELILTNHEELAVAIAIGYAKASGRPMVAMVHDTVGLLHASAPLFGALLDQVPVLVLGGTGPMAQEKRRPRIDWIHTTLIQGNAVRDFVKWDDQPSSIPGLIESMLRGHQISMTEPKGPVYIGVDAELQEANTTGSPSEVPSSNRYGPPTRMQADLSALDVLAEWLVNAEHPVVFADRIGRDEVAFEALQRLEETMR